LSKVIDLDILRPEPNLIKIGGKEIDVSFIPCGITFDLDAVVQDLMHLDGAKIKSDPDEMRRAFNLGIKLCALFCSTDHPEMDEKWFLDNTNANQVNALTTEIQKGLIKVYEDVGKHSKN